MPDLPNFIHCRQRAAISFSGAIADESARLGLFRSAPVRRDPDG